MGKAGGHLTGTTLIRLSKIRGPFLIACIEDPVVIKKILAHVDQKGTPQQTGLLPEGRATPVGRFG